MHWGSEYRASPIFKWLNHAISSKGSDFLLHPESRQKVLIWTSWVRRPKPEDRINKNHRTKYSTIRPKELKKHMTEKTFRPNK